MKYLKLLILPSILLAVIITGFSLKNNSNNNINSQPEADIELVEGVSEFYYKPAGDSRLWHVINRYGMDSNGKYTVNNSSYTFTSDSVLVVNEIAEVPEWEPYISGLIFKKN